MVRVEPDRENMLTKVSATETLQIRSIYLVNLIKKVGIVSPDTLSTIKTPIKAVIDAD